MLVLDTNMLIELDKGNKRLITRLKQLKALHSENIAITFANFSEYYYGILNKSEKKKQLALDRLLKFNILNTNTDTAKRFAELKHKLEKEGKAMSVFDVLIAAIVIDNKATLLTSDKHFKDIEELKLILFENAD